MLFRENPHAGPGASLALFGRYGNRMAVSHAGYPR